MLQMQAFLTGVNWLKKLNSFFLNAKAKNESSSD
jgi:hypothetical protein